MRYSLKNIILFMGIVVSLSMWVSFFTQAEDASACGAGRSWCNADEQRAYNQCYSGAPYYSEGAIWMNNSGSGATASGYYRMGVDVPHNATTVPVYVRGSVFGCGQGSGSTTIWASSVAIQGAYAGRFTTISGGLNRGTTQGDWRWTTQGGSATLNFNTTGLAPSTKTSAGSQTISIGIYRCFSLDGVNKAPSGTCATAWQDLTITRSKQPFVWSLTPTATITSAASVNQPDQTLTWQHRIKNNGPDKTDKAIVYTGGGNTWNASNISATNTSTEVNYRQQNSTHTITQADVGNNLCRRTTVTPQSSTNSNELASTPDACRFIPYNYSLVPTVSTDFSNGHIIESDETTYNVRGTITNQGPTKSRTDVKWQLTQINYAPGSAPAQQTGGTGAAPCTFFTGEASCTNITPSGGGTQASGFGYGTPVHATNNPAAARTYNAPNAGILNNGNNQPGSKICFVMSVRPYADDQNARNDTTGTYDTANPNVWKHSAPTCLIVGKSPKVQVWGGDVQVGRTFSGTSLQNSKVETSLTEKSTKDPVRLPFDSSDIEGFYGTGVQVDGITKVARGGDDPHWEVTHIRPGDSEANPCQGTSAANGWVYGKQAKVVLRDVTRTYNGISISSPPKPEDYGSNAAWGINVTPTGAQWIGAEELANNNRYSAEHGGCTFAAATYPSTVNPYAPNEQRFKDWANENSPTWVFKTNFTIKESSCIDLNTLRLKFNMAADDWAEVYVNGHNVGRAPSGTSVGGAGVWTDLVSFMTTPQSNVYRKGSNTLEIRVRSYSSQTGLIVDNNTSAEGDCRVDPVPNVFGSFSEYGIFAPSNITLMASGSGLNGGRTQSAQSAWSPYTFTKKTSGTNDYGSYTTPNTKLPDVTSVFPVATAAAVSFPSNTLNLSTLSPKSRAIKPAPGSATNLTLTANAGNTLNNGQWLVVNAVGHNITIDRDIRYANGPFTNVNQIPQLIIIADNITINDNVTNVDAWLVAKNDPARPTAYGAIATCNQRVRWQSNANTISTNATAQWLAVNYTLANTVANSPALTIGTCSNTLRINGPVIANKLYLRRTAGSGTGTAAGDPAEIINLRPDTYLWAQHRMNTNGAYRTMTVTELPPRY